MKTELPKKLIVSFPIADLLGGRIVESREVMCISEERKLTEFDLDVLACRGAANSTAHIQRLTGYGFVQVQEALLRALAVLPALQEEIVRQAGDQRLSALERQMAAGAASAMAETISWVQSLAMPVLQAA